MKRKVIRQANQAYTITLPIDWVRKNKIDEKTELDIAIKDKTLIINSGNVVPGGKIKIDVSGLDERSTHIQIDALYAIGIDEIEIVSDKDISRLINRTLNNIIGFALVKQSGNNYILKEVSQGNYSDLDEIFKRVFQMIIVFYESAIKDIFGEEKETIDDLKLRDAEVNKFCFLLQRAINKMSYEDQINGRTLFTYSFALEKISDEIERLWRTNIKYRIKKSKEIKQIAEISLEALSKAFDLYYQFNPKITSEIYKLREEVREQSIKLKKMDPNTIRFVRHIVKVAEDSADLNHLALMRKLG